MENFDKLMTQLIKGMKPYDKSEKNVGGVYAFWYNNHDGKLNELGRKFEIKLNSTTSVDAEWNWNLNNEKVCLYVGKSTKIERRVGLHLLRKTMVIYNNKETKLINKKTTSCQLRAGFDYLYLNEKEYVFLDEIKDRLEFSYIEEANFVTRFYLEDYLIGKLHPWFNLDSER